MNEADKTEIQAQIDNVTKLYANSIRAQAEITIWAAKLNVASNLIVKAVRSYEDQLKKLNSLLELDPDTDIEYDPTLIRLDPK